MVLGRGERRGQRAWLGMLAVLWAILPLALAVAVSVIQPMFFERYLSVVLPALAVVAAAVLTHLRPRPLAIAAVAGLCALHVPGIREWYGNEVNEDWRAAADRIGPRATAQERVLVYPLGAPTLAWYLGREVDSGPSLGGPRLVGSVDEVENPSRPQWRRLAATPRIWVVEMETSDDGEPARIARRHYEAPDPGNVG